MKKTTFLTASLLSALIISPSFANAQMYQSQAYGTTPAPATAYVPPYGGGQTSSTSSSSSGVAYRSAGGAFAPMNDRVLTDPLYLPLTGQVEGISSYVLNMPSASTYNYQGVKRTNTNSYTNQFAQVLEYGATDDFAIRVGESYSFGRSFNDNQVNGNDTSTAAFGFSDPTLGASYRFIDQRKGFPVDATFDLTYTPDMIKSQAAGGGESGNNAAGRQSSTFTADLGRQMHALTIDGFTGVTYEGEREFQTLSNGNTEQVDPFWNYFVGVNSQLRFTDRFSLNAGYRFTAIGNTQTSNEQTGLLFNQSNPNSNAFDVALNYHFIPNRVVGQLSYDYTAYTHSANTYLNPTQSNEVENQNSNTVALRLFYTFN